MLSSSILNSSPKNAELWQQGQQSWLKLCGALPTDAKIQDLAWQKLLSYVFCSSPFVAQVLLDQPDWVVNLLNENGLEIAVKEDNLRQLAGTILASDFSEAEFMRELRCFRKREIARIAIRDLLGWETSAGTLLALSALADVCVSTALDYANQQLASRYGTPTDEEGRPQFLVVLAMGKLGGRELNFSSDIDLIFAYPEPGKTTGGQQVVENQQYFLKLGQLLIKLLNTQTEDGFVYRVDMRLRPNGDSGPLVIPYASMEVYYQSQGRDWERYAMIKARPITGNVEHIDGLLEILKPFVYRRYLDYGAFESLREMKAMIMREVVRKDMQHNIKLGIGGIREIEFIGQAFQLIRGGREPVFRQRSIVAILRLLAEQAVFTAQQVEALLGAYDFLRQAENRLQMVADQQIHTLPSSELEQARLAYAMGYNSWPEFNGQLVKHLEHVSNCFQTIFAAREEEDNLRLIEVLNVETSCEQMESILKSIGFINTSKVAETLDKFRQHSSIQHMDGIGRQRLDKFLPLLLLEIVKIDKPEEVLPRILRLILAVVRRSVYLSLLIESPLALQQLIRLCEASPWVTELLQRHPALLDGLLDVRLLNQLPNDTDLNKQLESALQSLQEDDLEQQMEVLRYFKQEMILRVAAVDINSELPLMKVSDHLTGLAEVILEGVYNLAARATTKKYGEPVCRINNENIESGFAVIAYGKLGGIELGYSSDLDLVFLYEDEGEHKMTTGPQIVDNSFFFTRLAQKITHVLGAHTVGGILYEVDMRLRPDGASGLLVQSLSSFEEYQRHKAWTWEHQALVRARVIVGNDKIKQAFQQVRHEILTQARDEKILCKEVYEMRERMRQGVSKSKQGEFDLKQDRGGITDIEFMVQYGVLNWAEQYPELTQYTDNIRLLELFAKTGLMAKRDTEVLIDAYRHLRAKIHRLALLGENSVVGNSDSVQVHIDGVASIWQDLMGVGTQ